MAWFEEIRRRLEAAAPEDLPEDEPGARAAVLVPLLVRKGELQVLFTLRSDEVEHHKGQVSFPGGLAEESDENLERTALRECQEEIGLDPRLVLRLGRLSEMSTVTGFRVTPFVGAIPAEFPRRIAEAEIASIFEVPLRLFFEPSRRRFSEAVWDGLRHRVLHYDVGPHPVWGATARMMEELVDALSDSEAN
jgi:8-oxo-dGTP pyrophosphatase MutT (NUDIX family)